MKSSKIREAFLSNDLKSSARYYWATKLWLWDHYREFQGREDYTPDAARVATDSALNNMIKHINPLHFPKSTGRRQVDKRAEFKKYLTEEEWNKAEAVEKTYYFRLRAFNKEVDKLNAHYKEIWNNGQLIDMLPLPPRGNLPIAGRYNLEKMGYDEEWLTVKNKFSRIAK